MPHGIYKDYGEDRMGFRNPGPCILWDNSLGIGYKPRSRCNFVLNKCHGMPGTSTSLIILGEEFKSLSSKDATNLLKESAGFPLTYLNTSLGQNGGCNYDPTNWSFKYTSGQSASLYCRGRCDGVGLFGFEWFEYNEITEEYVSKGAIARFVAGGSGCAMNDVSGSGSLTANQIQQYLANSTTYPKNKNIIVALLDTNASDSVCGVGGGCTNLTVTLNYNGSSANFACSGSGCCANNTEDCHWWKKLPTINIGSSSGWGELNPFPCFECRKALESIGSVDPEIAPVIDSYLTCREVLPASCSSECCKFFFPCGDETIEHGTGPDEGCLRLTEYDLRGVPLPRKPCMNPDLPIASRLNDCNSYFVRDTDGTAVYPCRNSGCCINPCIDLYNIPRKGGDLSDRDDPYITDIITWDACPGNYKAIGVSNASYSAVRDQADPVFKDSGCSCGTMQTSVSNVCKTNPKTGEVLNTANGSACIFNTLTYAQLYNGQDCDPRKVSIVNGQVVQTECSLMNCTDIKKLGTICIPPVDVGQPCPDDGIHALTDFSEYTCQWSIDKFKEKFGDTFDSNKLVFQTCIDKQGRYPCKYWKCVPLQHCGSLPYCHCCNCIISVVPNDGYNNYYDCLQYCGTQHPGGCTTCP